MLHNYLSLPYLSTTDIATLRLR